ncbi:hypothetical protein VTI74DRAFT_3612 [Chaetomium olivicolor]
MPEHCSIRYTSWSTGGDDVESLGTQHRHSAVVLNLTDTSAEEVRWWRTLLTPSGGWEATPVRTAVCLIKKSASKIPSFAGKPGKAPIVHISPPVLQQFLHSLQHHRPKPCRPSRCPPLPFRVRRKRNPPPPSPNHHQQKPFPVPPYSSSTSPPDHTPRVQLQHLDALLTLSLHPTFARLLLLNPFYNPLVPYNAVTPWLQGALAALAPSPPTSLSL